jgi:hypothetical protein
MPGLGADGLKRLQHEVTRLDPEGRFARLDVEARQVEYSDEIRQHEDITWSSGEEEAVRDGPAGRAVAAFAEDARHDGPRLGIAGEPCAVAHEAERGTRHRLSASALGSQLRAGALSNLCTLQLREHGEHAQHRPARGRGRIEVLRCGHKPCAVALELLQQRECIGLSAAQAVHGIDDDDRYLAGGYGGTQLVKGGTVERATARARVDEHAGYFEPASHAECAASSLL